MLRQLTRLLGAEAVSAAPETLATHATDKWFASRAPEAVVFARTTEDVSRTLRFASKHGIPVTPRGAGFGYVGGCVPVRGGIALSLARMNRDQGDRFRGRCRGRRAGRDHRRAPGRGARTRALLSA